VPSLLEAAHGRAAEVAKLSGGSLLLGLSGKDSFVTLAIAAEHFKRIECFHLYTVRGLRCLEIPLQVVCARFGAKLHYVPSPNLARLMKHGVLRTHISKLTRRPEMKREDCERLIRRRTGIEWIAYGERLSDSFARRLFWRKINGIYEKGKRAALIVDWLDANVYAYMRAMKIPTPCTFGSSTKSTGFGLSRETLRWLSETHPDDYEKVLRVFPGAGAQLIDV
jgi:3'-phosphoadenosine 5'-phosphosulfate sulfotransferase (PAPS reductase)/FAD synthetase